MRTVSEKEITVLKLKGQKIDTKSTPKPKPELKEIKPPDPMKKIAESIAESAKVSGEIVRRNTELTAVMLNVLRDMNNHKPVPAKIEMPVQAKKEWVFKIIRNSDGYIDAIRAQEG